MNTCRRLLIKYTMEKLLHARLAVHANEAIHYLNNNVIGTRSSNVSIVLLLIERWTSFLSGLLHETEITF